MLSPRLYADLIGKPYEKGARGPGAYDCLGLAMEIARRLGKQVPAYVSEEAELHAQLGAGASSLADCPQIPAPVPGCIVLLRLAPTQHHLGVMVDAWRMIHAFRDSRVAIERILSPQWQCKIVGFYSLESSTESGQ